MPFVGGVHYNGPKVYVTITSVSAAKTLRRTGVILLLPHCLVSVYKTVPIRCTVVHEPANE